MSDPIDNSHTTGANYNPNISSDNKKILNKDKISSGDLRGDNVNISDKDESVKPLLDKNKPVNKLDEPNSKGGDVKNVDKEVSDIDIRTKKIDSVIKSLLTNIYSGSLTTEQKALLNEFSSKLTNSADYISFLQGDLSNQGTQLKSLFINIGVPVAYANDIMHLLDGNKIDESALILNSGGEKAYNAKQKILEKLGLNSEQSKLLLMLAPKDIDGSVLGKMEKAKTPSDVLKALGLNDDQVNKMLDVLDGKGNGTFLMSLGVDKQYATILQSMVSPEKLLNQQVLGRLASTDAVSLLKANSEGLKMLADQKVFTPEITKQLVDIFSVMILFHEMGVSQRRFAREGRAAAYAAARNELLNQSKEMEKAAMSSMIGGFVSASTKIIAGAVQTRVAVKAGNAPNQAVMQQQTAYANGISQMISATGDMIKAGMDYQAGMHQAQIKVSESIQKGWENIAQSESEFLNMYQDLLRMMRTKIEEIDRAHIESLKSSTRV